MGKISIQKNLLEGKLQSIYWCYDTTGEETPKFTSKIEAFSEADMSALRGTITDNERKNLYKKIEAIKELPLSNTLQKKNIKDSDSLSFPEHAIILSFAKKMFKALFIKEIIEDTQKSTDYILYNCKCKNNSHIHIILSSGWMSVPLEAKISATFSLHVACVMGTISEKNFGFYFMK